MKKIKLIIVQLLFFTVLVYSQKVSIDKQVWMTKNLNVDKFRNGDPIPQAKTEEEWNNALKNKQPAWCYYDNKPENEAKYGKLYNWYAVNDYRGLAPQGYHIPSALEWTALINYLGNQSLASKKIKSKEGWPNKCNGTNEVGFSGVPAGCRNNKLGFFGEGRFSYWWTSTESFNAAHSLSISFLNDIVRNMGTDLGNGLSVRCLKD